jgi:hypothetical protein
MGMGAILLPADLGRQSIQNPPSALWRHGRLARDLACAWLSSMPYANLVNGAVFSLSGSQSSFASAITDKGLGWTTNANGVFLQSATAGLTATAEFTIVTVQAISAANGDRMVSLGSGTGSNGNYILLGFDFQQPLFQVFTSSYQSLSGVATQTFNPARAICLGAVNSVSRSKRELWIDGRLDAESASAFTTGSANNLVLTLLNNSGTGPGCQSPVSLVLLWNRALTQEEMRLVTTAPWSVFAQRRRVLHANSGGAASSARRRVTFVAA